MSAEARAEHRAFLNRSYGVTRHVYDVTRKYYLFGRDDTLGRLCAEPWGSLVEVGPGTGRNLRLLRARRPDARLGGVDASDEMLAHARARCPWAALSHGFAEDADLRIDGRPPDRVLFSYVLSMVQEPARALANARAQLAPGGSVWAVDFGDLAGLPGPAAEGLRAWLAAFGVHPRRWPPPDRRWRGPAGYYDICVYRSDV